jgi:cytochrome c oxidase subunit 3
MAIFLGATAMLFAALLFAYAVLRAQASVWPPPGAPPFPRGAALANGLWLLAAGATIRFMPRAPWPRALRAAGAALGVGFAVAQVFLWRKIGVAHAPAAARLVGDVFFAISALHLLHLAGGLAAVVFASARRWRVVVMYWDFLFVVWAVIVLAVCVP